MPSRRSRRPQTSSARAPRCPGAHRAIALVTSRPCRPGICKSTIATCGRSRRAQSRAARPSAASPTMSTSPDPSSIAAKTPAEHGVVVGDDDPDDRHGAPAAEAANGEGQPDVQHGAAIGAALMATVPLSSSAALAERAEADAGCPPSGCRCHRRPRSAPGREPSARQGYLAMARPRVPGDVEHCFAADPVRGDPLNRRWHLRSGMPTAAKSSRASPRVPVAPAGRAAPRSGPDHRWRGAAGRARAAARRRPRPGRRPGPSASIACALAGSAATILRAVPMVRRSPGQDWPQAIVQLLPHQALGLGERGDRADP